jgi:ubiquinone/menaquinone biosynthesis C-methylase UbiE
MTTSPSPTVPAELLETVRTKHRALWASGDYPAVVAEAVAPLGPVLVAACGIRAGDRVLDVAAGSGNAAIPAALVGADVVASDLTPELFDAGRAQAADQGADLRWEQGDAHALPYPDEAFDVVMSCIGVMFAPFHQLAADELVRVTRRGGRIGVLSWTPDGFIGELFATLRPYAPPPPPGAQPPPLWGDETHVRDLLGDRVRHLRAETRTLTVDRFASGARLRDFFKSTYGPIIATYRYVGDDADRAQRLDEELAALGDSYLDGGTMQWEYLLVVATRR